MFPRTEFPKRLYYQIHLGVLYKMNTDYKSHCLKVKLRNSELLALECIL